MLDSIQEALYARAVAFRDDHTTHTDSYDEFKQIMEGRPGFVVSPWCGSARCEAEIKTETQATIRNIPFTETTVAGKKCLKCDDEATAHGVVREGILGSAKFKGQSWEVS